jgi:hypothetical protein
MTADYKDRRIECSPDALRIRGYYFPWGAKRIPHKDIRSVERVSIGALTGRGRIWGTANPRYWANLDPQRPGKKVAFILDTGHAVRPVLTPEDPGAFESALTAGGAITVEHSSRRIIM